jgi:hypothetical protein
VIVAKAATSIKLAVNPTVYDGKPFDFTATLSTVSAGAAPTGEVELKIGNTVIATAKLSGVEGTKSTRASGTVSISTVAPPPGNSRVDVVYVGDANYAGSTSNLLIVKGRPGFAITSVSNFSLSGEHTTGAVPLPTTSEGGYAGTVDYTCSLTSKTTAAAPPECAMYPATETLTAGGAAQPQILIFGKGTKLPAGITLGSNAKWVGAGGAVVACCLLFGIPARRRAWKSMLSAVLLFITVAGLSSCVTTPKLIDAGSYTFTVVGKDSKDLTNTATATVKIRVL